MEEQRRWKESSNDSGNRVAESSLIDRESLLHQVSNAREAHFAAKSEDGSGSVRSRGQRQCALLLFCMRDDAQTSRESCDHKLMSADALTARVGVNESSR